MGGGGVPCGSGRVWQWKSQESVRRTRGLEKERRVYSVVVCGVCSVYGVVVCGVCSVYGVLVCGVCLACVVCTV